MSALPQYGKYVHPQHTMRAIVIDRYGNPDVLREIETPRPVPRARQVLVRIRYIGVNPKDIMVRKGKFKVMTGSRFPRIIGHDIAGEVVEAGEHADLEVGDRVFGMINDFTGRGYAEYAAVNADQLDKAPRTIDLRAAAAVPLAAQTALQGLRRNSDICPGDEVLINGASGGVGVFAVQIAKILGARVTAVCSHRNIDLMRELGADEVIDYTSTPLTALEARFDVFFDVFGNYRFGQVRHLLKRRGSYVQTIPSSTIIRDSLLSGFSRQSASLVVVRSQRSQLHWLRAHIVTGQLKVVLDQSFPMAEAAAAHRHLETRRARGKVVLEVD